MFDLAPDAWMSDALCLEFPSDWWFPEKGEPAKRAKDVCARCLVVRECLTLAITENIQVGIFGGTGPADRRQMRTAGVSLEAALEASESRPQRERRLWLEQAAYDPRTRRRSLRALSRGHSRGHKPRRRGGSEGSLLTT